VTARAFLAFLIAAVTGLALAGGGSSAPLQPCMGSQLVTPTPGTGTFVAPIKPATPVCEHGGMQVSAFSAA
jgi:hypothetical protein